MRVLHTGSQHRDGGGTRVTMAGWPNDCRPWNRRWIGCGPTCSTIDRLIVQLPLVVVGASVHLSPSRAALGRPARWTATTGGDLRRSAGVHQQRRTEKHPRPPCKLLARALRELACRDLGRNDAAAGHQERRCPGPLVRQPEWRRAGPFPRSSESHGCSTRPTCVTSGGHQRRPGSDQTQPPGQVPPGRGVPAGDRTSARPGSRRGRGRAAAHRRPWLRQRLPDLCRIPVAHRSARARRAGWSGVDVKSQARRRNTELAAALGGSEVIRFVEGTIADADPRFTPHVVLALHACDTATDDALARAVRWKAPVVLAAPCCHHDVQRHSRSRDAASVRPAEPSRHPSRAVRRRPHRWSAPTCCGSTRVPGRGRRVRRVQAHAAQHLLRAVRHRRADAARATEYVELISQWGLQPALQARLARSIGCRCRRRWPARTSC